LDLAHGKFVIAYAAYAVVSLPMSHESTTGFGLEFELAVYAPSFPKCLFPIDRLIYQSTDCDFPTGHDWSMQKQCITMNCDRDQSIFIPTPRVNGLYVLQLYTPEELPLSKFKFRVGVPQSKTSSDAILHSGYAACDVDRDCVWSPLRDAIGPPVSPPDSNFSKFPLDYEAVEQSAPHQQLVSAVEPSMSESDSDFSKFPIAETVSQQPVSDQKLSPEKSEVEIAKALQGEAHILHGTGMGEYFNMVTAVRESTVSHAVASQQLNSAGRRAVSRSLRAQHIENE